MAISPLWAKPPRWPIQPGAVDPGQRWVWHTRPRFMLPLWEHASAGAAQRYVGLAQTRRTARAWQLNTVAAAMRTRYGPGVSIPRSYRTAARWRHREQDELNESPMAGAHPGRPDCVGPTSNIGAAAICYRRNPMVKTRPRVAVV